MDQETHATNAPPLTDETAANLLERIEEGDKAALADLYDKTNRLLFGLILRILGDRPSAEEALVDVYMRVWREPVSRDPDLLPMEWLTALARSRAIARLHWNRQLKRKQAFQARNIDPAMTVAPDRQEFARHALASLAPAQQEILGWVYYSGMSCAEIAAQLGKPVGAVKTHSRLGMNKLSDLFRPFIDREAGEKTPAGGNQ